MPAKLTHVDEAQKITMGKDIKIAIIDTGAEKEHPDLKGQIRQIPPILLTAVTLVLAAIHMGRLSRASLAARANDGV